MPRLRRTLRLDNRAGLHARPISRIVEVARRHEAALTVHHGGRSADGRSILELMTLAAAPDTEVELLADGPDAAALLTELEVLFQSRFGED